MDASPLLRALFDSNIDVQYLLRCYGIYTRLCQMETSIQAFVWVSRRGRYYVIANEALSPEVLREVFWHELCHILNDAPCVGYWVGLDRQRYKIEQRADMFHEIAATYLA